MKKILITISIFTIGLLFTSNAFAQNDSSQEFIKVKVTQITQEGEKEVGGYTQPFQKVKVELPSKKEILINHGGLVSIEESEKVKEGETVILSKIQGMEGDRLFIIDKYRLSPIIFISLIFIAIIFIFAGLKGITSLLGLCFSIFIIGAFIVPQILAGKDPLTISLIGATFITCISIFLAHGFNKQTLLAVVSTLISLVLAAFTAIFFVSITKLFGTGSETAYALQISGMQNINLRGLLLGGIIIGVLGVLDDVTTTQTATVNEIHKANSELSFKELYRRGISVGKEHMISMVNTLALAYAGVSLPLFLLFTLNEGQPFWVLLNSEFIAEELIRTLVGSSILILAVPLATLISAYSYGRKK